MIFNINLQEKEQCTAIEAAKYIYKYILPKFVWAKPNFTT